MPDDVYKKMKSLFMTRDILEDNKILFYFENMHWKMLFDSRPSDDDVLRWRLLNEL